MPASVDLKSQAQLSVMRKAGVIVWEILQEMAAMGEAGASTFEIDRMAEARTKEKGARPAVQGGVPRDFPASVCISINEEVVHGIPSKKRVLRAGDLLKLDFGVILDGLFADSAVTVPVGQVSAEGQRLIDVTRSAMHQGIAKMAPDNRLHDIGHAVQTHVEAARFSV